MIDLHSHLLPGLDDGARSLEESTAIAGAMARDGVRIVAATPHVRDDYPTTPEEMTDSLATVRAAVAAAALDIDVRGGGEIAVDWLGRLDSETLAAFGLGNNPNLVLIEYPYFGQPLALAYECARLRERDVVPVIAHPERNAVIQERPEDLKPLVRAGALIQLTGASVDGRLGRTTSRCALRLLELELAHLLASDAHSPSIRESGLSGACRAIGNAKLAQWLAEEVPAALLTGDELPQRPIRPRRRLLRR